MGRRKPAWQQQREADVAKAREQYYATRPHTTSTTVKVRATDKAVYTSMNVIRGGTHALFQVPISKASRDFFGGYTALGLQDPATVTDPVTSAPGGRFKPSKVLAREGIATPTAHITPWNSRVIKYTTSTTGTEQANFSAPFGTGATSPTPDTLDARASQIYNAIKGKLGNLTYAEFYWIPEAASFSKS
jgi:hypothetical protein